MNKPKDKKRKLFDTPSQFYRNRRPEYFSDSKKAYEVQLPKEHLAFELSQISTNMKQDEFETLCRKLAERFITPNLIPQVGPVGGGDGKTDFETYPVSESIANRWFVPENGWEKDEKWAFAISSKKDWKSKAKSDIEKIVNTGRGYTRVYFFTNQKLASKKKKDAQDEFINRFGVDVIIFDGEWIIENVYGANLTNLIVDTLNLSSVYKKDVIELGENDAYRLKKLAETEKSINNSKRYFEYDYQLVEDALQSAVLTRMLEKDRPEVEGKFDRALRFAKKVNNSKQLVRVYYQRAWTFLNWYDDYFAFVEEFRSFKNYISETSAISEIELYVNLIHLLRTVYLADKVGLKALNIDAVDEIRILELLLDKFIDNESKPSSSLIAKTFKKIFEIFEALKSKENPSQYFITLQEYFEKSVNFVDYPFDSFKTTIEVFGEIVPNNAVYDDLIDAIALIQEKRASELAAGDIFLKRGYQKLSAKLYKDSIVYFGKAVMKFAKEESHDYFYFAIIGLYHAYSLLSLSWAAYNCLAAATSITIKKWYDKGIIDKRLYHCAEELVVNELFIGRIPIFLSWHELFQVVSQQVEVEDDDETEQMPQPALIDACLAVRLINTNWDTWSQLSFLPDLLDKETLWLSQDTCLYMLGYSDLLNEANYKSNLDKHFDAMARQPFTKQMLYETSLLTDQQIQLTSTVLGTKLCISFKKVQDLLFLAETILAYFEAFLATSMKNVYPSVEIINMKLCENTSTEGFSVTQEPTSSEFVVEVNLSFYVKEHESLLRNFLLDLTSQVMAKNFVIDNPQEHLTTLFKKEELLERIALIFDHKSFLTNVLGDKPKLFLEDWINSKDFKEYPLKRSSPLAFNKVADPISNMQPDAIDIDQIKHNQRKVLSIIDSPLWDKAWWVGFGNFATNKIPFGIFIAFNDGEAGKIIFSRWIKQYGNHDKSDEIRIAIIRGIDKNNPNIYRVSVMKRFDNQDFDEGKLIVTPSRFHEITPETSKNLDDIIVKYNCFRRYVICPARIKADNTIDLYQEYSIMKTKLEIKFAWEIGEHDIDRNCDQKR